jgi:plasmid stabilization system protein ParE
MKLRILDSALEDLDRGRLFYERQGEGLGPYFLDSLFGEIDSLVLYAGVHRKVFGFHRLIVRRFPYGIYYRLEEDGVVVVWRVLDLRRSPSWIRKALS